MQNRPAYPVGAADTVLRVLLLLSEAGELRVSDAASRLGVARSTAHRMLAMLVLHGFAEKDGRRIYRPGPALRQVAGRPRLPPELVTAAQPTLRRLAGSLRETVHLMVLEGNGVRFVDGVEGPQTLRVGPRTGMLLPAHATSGGKVLLAELPDSQLAALYPRGLPGGEKPALTDLAALRRELTAVRRRGYATNSEESERGVSAVGAVIRDRSGRAVAAVAVAAPSSRSPRGRLRELAPHVIEGAQAVSAAL